MGYAPRQGEHKQNNKVARSTFPARAGRRRTSSKAQRHTPVGKVGVQLGKQLFRQMVLFREVAKDEDSHLVRDRTIAELYPGKPALRLDDVKALLRHGVAQSVPALEEVDPQLHLQWQRRASFNVPLKLPQPAQRTRLLRFHLIPTLTIGHCSDKHTAPKNNFLTLFG